MVMFPDGFTSAGTIVKLDRDWDLAAIAIWRPNAEPLPLATSAPQPGETLTIAGYGSGNFRSSSGRCTQYVAPGTTFPYEMVELATTARQGDSGGPILNTRGELAGVLFGEGGGRTAGSYCGRVQWFLAGLTPPDSSDAAGAMLAAASTSPLAAQSVSVRTPQSPFNPLAAPSQPGARVNSLAALGLPAAAPTASAVAPPRAIGPTATFASAATGLGSTDAQNSNGWQSAPPRGLANPDRDPPAPRERPAPTETALVEVPRMRGIPDPAAFGQTSAGMPEPIDQRPDAVEQAPDDNGPLELHWTDIAGNTIGEQIKSVLATIGGLAVVMQAIGLLSRDSKTAKPPTAQKKPARKKRDDDDDDDDEDEDDD